MKRALGGLLVGVLLGGGLAAPAAARIAEGDKPPATEEKKEKKKKEEKKDTKRTSSAATEPARPLDTRQVLSRLVRSFNDGIEGLSPSVVRELVDEKKFYDYPRFEDGVSDFLRSAGEMRLFTREVNLQIEGDKAVMVVEAEMAWADRHEPDRREQRRSRITFDFERTDEGWKITEINPRNFFLP